MQSRTFATTMLATALVLSHGVIAEEKQSFESFEQLMDQFEFEWEVHPVTTDDGYILNMFRLVAPKPDSDLYKVGHRIVRENEKFFPERMQKIKDEQQAKID